MAKYRGKYILYFLKTRFFGFMVFMKNGLKKLIDRDNVIAVEAV